MYRKEDVVAITQTAMVMDITASTISYIIYMFVRAHVVVIIFFIHVKNNFICKYGWFITVLV